MNWRISRRQCGHPGPDPEVITQVHVQKRRDVEKLSAMLVKRVTVIFDPDHVTMPLAEGVVHLIDQSGERGIRPVAKEYAQRIEAIAERARHAEQANLAA